MGRYYLNNIGPFSNALDDVFRDDSWVHRYSYPKSKYNRPMISSSKLFCQNMLTRPRALQGVKNDPLDECAIVTTVRRMVPREVAATRGGEYRCGTLRLGEMARTLVSTSC
jgi:hypothetical protein